MELPAAQRESFAHAPRAVKSGRGAKVGREELRKVCAIPQLKQYRY